MQYEKVKPQGDAKDSDKTCFNCSYKYPPSNFTHDQSGFLCNQCSDFEDRYVFGPGETAVVEVDGEKYRVWYVDISLEEVCAEIKKTILFSSVLQRYPKSGWKITM